MSLFVNLLKKYPNKKWNMVAISSNPNVSLKFITENPEIKWEWYYGVSRNSNLTKEFVNENINKDWDWKYLSEHLNVNKNFINKNRKKIKFKYLSRNKYITLSFVDNNDYPWHINDGLTHNPNLRIWYVKETILNLWSMDLVSENKYLPLEDIDKYSKSYNWNWSKIIRYNTNITIEFVIKHIRKFNFEDLHYLSNKKNITMEIIENHPNFPWHYGRDGVSNNPNLSIKFLLNNFFDKKFDIFTISSHPNFDFDILKNNQNIFYSLGGVSANPNLTAKFINKNINLRDEKGEIYDLLDFSYFSENKLIGYNNKIKELKNSIQFRKDLFNSLLIETRNDVIKREESLSI